MKQIHSSKILKQKIRNNTRFKLFAVIDFVFLSFLLGNLQFLTIRSHFFNSDTFSFFSQRPSKQIPILNYSKKWLNNIDIKKLKKPLKKIPSCSFTPKRTRTALSTTDDLLLSTLFGQVTGLVPFTKSWATIKSNATCVILIDTVTRREMKKEKINETEIQENGVHLIDVGDFRPPKRKGAGLYMIPNFEFIARFGHHFNHIIIVDGNDEAFQGDPFQRDYQWNNLGFFFERFTLNNEPTNKMWVGQLRSWYPSWNFESEPVNTGLITGTSEQILTLGNLMVSVWNAPHFPHTPHDQGMVSYLIMNSFMRDAGLEYFTRKREILGVYRYPKDRTYEIYPNYTSVFIDDDALIVHYYTRDAKSIQQIRKICKFDENVPLKCDIKDEPKGKTPCRRNDEDIINFKLTS